MKQLTLFDKTPSEVDTRPLLRTDDDVWEVSLRAQVDGSDGSVRVAVQVAQAVTEELAYWHLSETRVNATDIERLIASEIERWRHQFEAYNAPF